MAQEESPKRRFPRVKKLNLVQISRFDEEGFRADLATGRTLDISLGGIRLELYHALPLRSVVGLTLALDGQLVEISGTVVYLEAMDHERTAMGIEFSDLSLEARALVNEYIESLEASK